MRALLVEGLAEIQAPELDPYRCHTSFSSHAKLSIQIPCQGLLSRAPFLGTQRVAPISRSMSPTTLRAQQRRVLAQELASFSAQAATASSCVAADVARKRSTSRAAIAPDPAEVTAWR